MKRGSKVKFVFDEDLFSTPDWVNEKLNLPKVGEIYTIRGLDNWGNILLNEINNPTYKLCDGSGELGFSESRFIPIEELSFETVDEILDKISICGMISLTESEKTILKNFKK